MSEGRHIALPDMRELLFADLPPLTAFGRYEGMPAVRALAGSVLGEDREVTEAALDAILRDAVETRVRLQAWSLARAAGIRPPSAAGRRARGVVVDVGLDAGTDTLAGFEDGSARYLHHAGGAIVWDASDEAVGGAVSTLVEAGQAVADASRPLDGPRPPAPGPGGGAIWILTEGGIHAGIGPFGALSTDSLGGPVIAAAIDLMRLLIERDAAARQP